jgi:hypothetical protein
MPTEGPTPEEIEAQRAADEERLRRLEEQLRLQNEVLETSRRDLETARERSASAAEINTLTRDRDEQQRIQAQVLIELTEQRRALGQEITAQDEARRDAAERTIEPLRQQSRQYNRMEASGHSLVTSITEFGQHAVFNTRKMEDMWHAFKDQGAKKFLSGLTTGFLKGFLDAVIGLSFGVDKMESSFQQATGASEGFARNLTSVYEDTRQYGVSAQEASAANEALYGTFTDFTMLAPSVQQEVAKTTQVLGEFGVAAGDVAKGMQIATKAFGESATEAAASAREITALAMDLGVAPKQLAADFASVGGQLAKMGSNGTQAFKDLAMRSKATGLEIGKLLQMTEKFDTFEGAAEQAGKLNAALGGNFVNAMDLMMETDPSARFDMMRDSILDAGLSFDDMSYYQRKFYTDALGLSDVSDLAMMLSGEYDSLTGDIGKTSAEIEDQAKKAAQMKDSMEQLKNALLPLIPVVTWFADKLSDLATWIATNIKWLKPLIYTIGGLALGLKVLYGVIKVGNVITAIFGSRTKTAGRGIKRMGKAIGQAGVSAAPAIPIIGAFAAALTGVGLAALGIGAGIALAALGMSILVSSFANLADMDLGILTVGMLGVVGAIWALAGAATALGNPMAMTGLFALGIAAAGIGLLISAFKKDKKQYDDLTQTFEALGQIKSGQLEAAERAFGAIGESITKVPRMKILGFTGAIGMAAAAMTAASALTGLRATVEGGGAAADGPGGAGGGTQKQGDRYTVPLTLTIDGDKFKEKVLTIVDGRIAEGARQ